MGDYHPDRLVGRVEFYHDADYHDIHEVAKAIEGLGYLVDHLIDPEEDEPQLYIED